VKTASPITAVVLALGLGSVAAYAGEIETEHLFAFLVGTDVGDLGDREIEGGTTARVGKPAGFYSALSQTLSLEYTPTQNLRLEATAAAARHDIVGVPQLDDRRQTAFEGLSFEMRYRLLDRANAPFGLAIKAEPHWGRIDETSGEPADRYGVDLVLAADKEIVPNRVVAAFNLLYLPEILRSGITGAWSREATIGAATALMAQVRSGIFVGAEARYLRSYEGLGLDRFEGHALFLGPTVHAKLSERSWMTLGWSFQVAGRSVEDTGSLDLTNFERHQAILKFGVNF